MMTDAVAGLFQSSNKIFEFKQMRIALGDYLREAVLHDKLSQSCRQFVQVFSIGATRSAGRRYLTGDLFNWFVASVKRVVACRQVTLQREWAPSVCAYVLQLEFLRVI